VAKIIKAVLPLTMVHETGIEFIIHETVRLIQDEVPGAIVECGVWRGGCSIACLLAQRAAFGRVVRPVYLLDSFEGLPQATAKDGPLALSWQQGEVPETFLDNCRAAEGEVQQALQKLDFGTDDAIVIKGWFKDTLARTAEEVKGGIALLRLDADWYDSTMECLVALEPLASEGATVIVDDYYAWDGCARAVHDYFSRRELSYRIKSLPYNFGMFFTKRRYRSSYSQF